MHIVVSVFRWLVTSVVATVLVVGAITATTLMGVASFFGDESNVRTWLLEEKVYSALADAIPDLVLQTDEIAGQADTPELALAQTKAGELIDEHLTYSWYQSAVNEVVPGVFDWLQAETVRPQFRVQLASSPQQFRTIVADAMVLKLQSLSECSTVELSQQAQSELLGADCVPQGLTLDRTTLLDYINQQATVNPDAFAEFTSQAVISSDSLDIQQEDSTRLQELYNNIETLPLYFYGMVAALTAILILIWLSISRGLVVGGISLAVGSVLILSVAVLGYGVIENPVSFALRYTNSNAIDDPTVQALAAGVSAPLYSLLLDNIRNLAIIHLAIGVGMAIFGWLLGKWHTRTANSPLGKGRKTPSNKHRKHKEPVATKNETNQPMMNAFSSPPAAAVAQAPAVTPAPPQQSISVQQAPVPASDSSELSAAETTLEDAARMSEVAPAEVDVPTPTQVATQPESEEQVSVPVSEPANTDTPSADLEPQASTFEPEESETAPDVLASSEPTTQQSPMRQGVIAPGASTTYMPKSQQPEPSQPEEPEPEPKTDPALQALLDKSAQAQTQIGGEQPDPQGDAKDATTTA